MSEKSTVHKLAKTDPAAAPEAKARDLRAWFQKKRFIIPIALVLLGVLSNAVNGGSEDIVPNTDAKTETQTQVDATNGIDVPDVIGKMVSEARDAASAAGIGFDAGDASDDWVVTAQEPLSGVDEGTAAITLTVSAEPPVLPLTLGQENAIDSALSYLDYSGFSRDGLLDQLTSEYGEGYPQSDAKFAISYLENNGLVDWNAEAVEAAQSYLDYSSFSRSGLFDQLTSEYGAQFTSKQANHALKMVGY